jgi:DNA-binding XRE family transcriptional regulator
MPEMDGLILASRLIALWPAINIIFVTGYKEYALEAHELYCSAFLMKPVGRRKLENAFNNLRKPFLNIPQDFLTTHYSGGAVIGKKIETLRELRGISRQEIADLMGVKRQTVYRWEHGERLPDVLTFITLTRLLGVKISDIVEISDLSDLDDLSNLNDLSEINDLSSDV